jgi:TolA-binding protein
MTEEELKQVVENLLEIQNNNDYNFQLLSAKIDALQQRVDQLQGQYSEIGNMQKMFKVPTQNSGGDFLQVINSPDA